MTSRLEKFRELRHIKRRFKYTVLLMIVTCIAGIFVVDYSVSSLLTEKRGIYIIAFKKMKSYIEMSIMDEKIYIDTHYLADDISKLKKIVEKAF